MSNLFTKLTALPAGQEHSTRLFALLSWIEEKGGAGAFLDRINDRGAGHLLADLKQSVSPVFTHEHISQIISQEDLIDLAQRMKVDPNEAFAHLNEYLPSILQHFISVEQQSSDKTVTDSILSLLREKLLK
ncbi:YidB family protein [Serratia marcescens]|uniref:YidB family protein n=1 Tax=Serratia marcescens TaxID=615 RepID=UPI00124AAE1F|nr:YidB family protein [Serratia marcescens]KAB1579182.1 hypothetical protein F7687_18225 [Serratia marcescens]